jgi:rod shape-determining protein MreD
VSGGAGRGLTLAVVFVGLVLLHFTVRPLLGWRAAIDFLAIALLLVAVRVRPGGAALVGLACGLVIDALAPASFGAGAVAMASTGFAASWLKAAFFADNLPLNGVFVFAGKWGFDVIYLLLAGRLAGGDLWWQLGVWSPLAGAATALTAIAVMVLLRPVTERAGP